MRMNLATRLVSTAFLLFAAAANAQFTSSGGNTTTTDNVGVGSTVAPYAKFEVFGVGNAGGMSMKATTANSSPYGFFLMDSVANGEGYGAGLVVNYTGNSLIRLSNLQIGYVGYPLLQSLGTQPLYLNMSANNDVVVGNSVFAKGLHVDFTGTSYFRGYLGAGTTIPISPLHSNGTLTVGSGSSAGVPGMVQIKTGGGGPLDNRLTFGTDGTGWKFAIAKNQGGTVSDLLAVQDNGNVGIGTIWPAQKLSVAGAIESTSGGFKFPDGTVQTSAASGSGSGSGSGGNSITVTGSNPQYVLSSTASAQRSTLSTDGAGLAIDVLGHATAASNFIVFRTTNVASSFTPVEAMRITSTGVLQIAPAGADTATVRLNVNGSATITGTLTANSVVNAVYGQDVAEWVRGDRELAAGTVVIVNPGKTNEVMPSSTAYDTTVAGVVSAQPGVILGRPGELKATVATSGRVRVRVDARKGAVHVGDLLVTSDEPGTAMKSQPIDVGGRKFHQPGTILGKALEPLPEGVGEILVLLCLG
jgi:hypothetical protein